MFTDLQFITRVSIHLDMFARKDQYLWNFRCPFCGDSKKSTKKARGYIYRRGTAMFFRCHNCSVGMTFGNFLKQIDPQIYAEFCLAKYKSEGTEKKANPRESKSPSKRMASPRTSSNPMARLEAVGASKVTDEKSFVGKYLLSRKVPKEQWKRLYFIENVQWLTRLSATYRDTKVASVPALILPCLDQHTKALIGVSARSLGNTKFRYLTFKLKPQNEMIFGAEQIDPLEPVFVVEGPIDSLFLPNCVASIGTSFDRAIQAFPESHRILVFDNQPRNRELCKIIRKHIKLKHRVCLFPSSVEQKDLNDMVLAGATNLMQTVMANTYRGNAALLEFGRWQKI